MFVKPANAGSSIGINKAVDLESLKEAVKIAFSHDNKVIMFRTDARTAYGKKRYLCVWKNLAVWTKF